MARAPRVPYGRGMFARGFRIASIGGIAIEVHPSWFIIVGVVSWMLASAFFPQAYAGWSAAAYWITGIGAALLLFVTVLLHELAHAVVAIRRGLEVPRITLFVFGGVSHLSRQPRTAGEEFAIAAAGPAASLALALAIGAAWFAVRGSNEQLGAICSYLAAVNLLLAIFNVLPGFPLDGGRVLRSIAWRRTRSFGKATRIAAGTGEAVAWALVATGLALLFLGQWLTGVWLGLIGWFLLGAARGEAGAVHMDAVLARLRARDLMRADFTSVVPGASVRAVVDEHVVGRGERVLMVANGGAVLGAFSVGDLRRARLSDWDVTSVQRIMTPRAEVTTITADAPASELAPLFAQRRLDYLPVLEDGRMVGLITSRDFRARLRDAAEPEPGR